MMHGPINLRFTYGGRTSNQCDGPVNGQLHVLIASHTGKQSSVHVLWEAGLGCSISLEIIFTWDCVLFFQPVTGLCCVGLSSLMF